VTALHCHVGQLVLREPLVLSSYAASATPVPPATEHPSDTNDGLDVTASLEELADLQQAPPEPEAPPVPIRDVKPLAIVTDGGDGTCDEQAVRLRPPAPETASALWWTWWSSSVPAANVAFDDPSSLLGAMHHDLRPLVAALLSEPLAPAGGRARKWSVSEANDMAVGDYVRRNGWRPPRRPLRIVASCPDASVATARLDEVAPLPGTPHRQTLE